MKILLTHTPHMRDNYYGPRALVGLSALGDVVLHQGGDTMEGQALIAAAKGCDLIVADRATALPAAIFDALPALKAALRCAVDIRNIDVAAASSHGILVTRAKPGFVESVTELVFGFLVDLNRGVSRAAAAFQAGKVPTAEMGRQLSGTTIGIIGYGAIGRAVAPIAAAMGMRVLISDPHVTIKEPAFQQVDLATLLAQSDHVVCLAVANEATENLINAAAFAQMRKDAVFINVSRGNLVDEAALTAAITQGKIAGAAIDVGRAPDQMPTPAIAALPNVIATPHIGGLTPPAIEAQALNTVEQVRALVSGAVPEGAANAENWTRRI
ncbi:NAD(P)-dependent oxidoreductase [Bradyrhizobium erythrophlei]|uniref:D-3-phosphoglycerate dehydrogenase n=1 Tax=Bradyrhizobium erythrophlei TaxID=1437360 RepID=A0A1M7T1N5_9BRAD|nr:NAD(P)-dependent oxidoreductase [Bradyrhizobium erythrophlei]SHN64618.1 D-3-phosphoglycerate dehydrogenase [Bradyrhizobium erythrophlei]